MSSSNVDRDVEGETESKTEGGTEQIREAA